MHWGVEYQTAPTPEQQAQAQTLLASPDVDLILGDHVHVLQPVQKIGDKYVIYGLGNLLSNQSPAAGLTPNTEDGAILTAQVRAQNGTTSVERVTYTATYVEIGPYTVWPTSSQPARRLLPAHSRRRDVAARPRARCTAGPALSSAGHGAFPMAGVTNQDQLH